MLLQTTKVFQTYLGVAQSRVCPYTHKGLVGEVDKQHLGAQEYTLWIKKIVHKYHMSSHSHHTFNR